MVSTLGTVPGLAALLGPWWRAAAWQGVSAQLSVSCCICGVTRNCLSDEVTRIS